MATSNPYQRCVKDIVKTDVVSVAAEDNLQTALELMADYRLTALPVLDGLGHCTGILSASDIVEAARDLNNDLGRANEISYQWLLDNMAEHDLSRHLVGEFMTQNVATVTSASSVLDAAREMLEHHIHRLPVVDRNSKVRGIISTMDILAAFVEGSPEK